MATQTFCAHVNHKVALYQQAMDLSDINCVVISSGNSLFHFRDDLTYPFKVNPYFKEFLPLTEQPECFLLLERDNPTPTLLIKETTDFWHSTPEALDEQFLAPFSVQGYSDAAELRHYKTEGATALIAEHEDYPALCPEAQRNPEPLLVFIDYHRAVKTDHEIDCIRSANRLALKGHRAAKKAFHEGKSELQIHLDYLQATGQLEEQTPYPNIIAVDKHAAILHHTRLDNRQFNANSLLIDAGASYRGYASDITRTYSVENEDHPFSALLKGVDSFQQKLVSQLQAGSDFIDLHQRAHQFVAQLLCELNIVLVSPEQALGDQITSAFFPHGIGHLLGLQVHERGGHMSDTQGSSKPPPVEHPYLRCTRALTENMVFTVEPGIYFIPSLLETLKNRSPAAVDWKLVDQLLPYGGIRIEDNILFRQGRAENITRTALKETN